MGWDALDTRVGEWGIPVLVILVGLSSFGLGRLSAQQEMREAISVRSAPIAKDTRALVVGGLLVASKSGTSYHFPWCPGAETMKESNKVWFEDESAAKKAGYKPAGNCPGLR